MVCIATYDDNLNVIGCTREDGVSGNLDFLAECEALGFTITYKTQVELDAEALKAKEDEERVWRDTELANADIQIFKLEDAGQDTTSYRAYRIALRDYPQQSDFPNGTRPVL